MLLRELLSRFEQWCRLQGWGRSFERSVAGSPQWDLRFLGVGWNNLSCPPDTSCYVQTLGNPQARAEAGSSCSPLSTPLPYPCSLGIQNLFIKDLGVEPCLEFPSWLAFFSPHTIKCLSLNFTSSAFLQNHVNPFRWVAHWCLAVFVWKFAKFERLGEFTKFQWKLIRLWALGGFPIIIQWLIEWRNG